MNQTETEAEGRSLALRLFIHLISDLHQPMHTVSMFNTDFPEGDFGGNKFYVKGLRIKNLHDLWDSVMSKYQDTIKLVY